MELKQLKCVTCACTVCSVINAFMTSFLFPSLYFIFFIVVLFTFLDIKPSVSVVTVKLIAGFERWKLKQKHIILIY